MNMQQGEGSGQGQELTIQAEEWRGIDVPILNGEFAPRSLKEAWKVCSIFARSGLVPKAYIGNPDAVLVAWGYGMQVGLGLLPALQRQPWQKLG